MKTLHKNEQETRRKFILKIDLVVSLVLSWPCPAKLFFLHQFEIGTLLCAQNWGEVMVRVDEERLSRKDRIFLFLFCFSYEYGCCDWLEFLISNFMYSGQQLHKFTLFTQFSQLFSTPFQLFSTPFLRSCQREFVRQSRASLGTISLILVTLKLASVYGKETLAARNSDRFKARNVSISHGEQLSRKYIQN